MHQCRFASPRFTNNRELLSPAHLQRQILKHNYFRSPGPVTLTERLCPDRILWAQNSRLTTRLEQLSRERVFLLWGSPKRQQREYRNYFTTTFTSLSGRTITFMMCLPSING